MRAGKFFKLGIALSSLALSIALPQLAFSADQGTEKAPIDETKQHDRGFGFTPMDGSANETPVHMQSSSKATIKPVVQKVNTAKHRQPATAKNAAEEHGMQQSKRITSSASLSHPNKSATKNVVNAGRVNSKETVANTTASVVPKRGTFETASETTQTGKNSPNMLVKFTTSAEDTVISARLDRTGTIPTYKVGDKMVVKVKANKDCNVVVFNFDSTGTLTQIFPNDYQQNGFVRSGESVEIGGADSPFDYQIGGKGGLEKIFVYAYPAGTEFNSALTAMTRGNSKHLAMAPITGTPFRGAEMTVDEYRKLVNGSQVFFSRSVEVKPKAQHNTAQLVSNAAPASSPNKVELTFNVDK